MISFNATLLVILVSFVIFMLLMKAVYFDPIMKIKHEREAKLTGDRDAALEFEVEYARLRAEYEEGLRKARKEAHAAIQEIRQKAKADAQQVLNEARAKANEEMEQKLRELADWRETTYHELEADREKLTRTIIEKVTSGGRVTTARGA